MTAQGTLVRDLMTEAPTESPTVPDVAPVSAPTTTTQASPPSGSSISTCVSGAVAEVIASTMVKWQATNLISEQWCEENMIRLAYDICKCITAHETLTRDVTTEPPTESLAIDNAVESCSEVSSTPGSNPTSEQGLSYDQSFPKNGETQEGALESTVGSHSSSNPREERSAPTPADDKTASQMLEGNDQEATTSATQRNPQTMNRSNANRLTDKFASYCLALYLAAHFVAR